MNISFIIGNLGADAEIKEANGAKFITFSVADTRKFKVSGGDEQVVTNWVDAIIPNAEHPVFPYLKQGVKVAIVGQSGLRVYSSKKDRCMKAGQTIHVLSVELCGGVSDDVPKQLIDPNTGAVVEVRKFYYACADKEQLKQYAKGGFVDGKGCHYLVDKDGWVRPDPEFNDTEDANAKVSK